MVKNKSSFVVIGIFCVPVIHTLAHDLQEINNYDTSIVGLLDVLVCIAQWINNTPEINRTPGINKTLYISATRVLHSLSIIQEC